MRDCNDDEHPSMGTYGLLELLPSASGTFERVLPLKDDDSRRVELIQKLAAKHKNAPKKQKTGQSITSRAQL